MSQLAERFWIKVNRRGPDECWEWTGCKMLSGYGRIASGRKRPVCFRAHRASWILTNGEIADELCVCHRCDNRLCVNPAHLFLGTSAENTADRDAKGRGARQRGDAHGRRKLDAKSVAEIRARYANGGILQRELAAEYGVTQTNVGLIVRGDTWQDSL